MTRKEAITELNTFKVGAKSELGEKALDMAIKALEQKPCEDVVSRKYVAEFLRNHAKDFEGLIPRMAFMAASSLVENTNNIPSVMPAHIEQESILDKIKTEIDLETRVQVKHYTNTDVIIDAVLDMIDKYKAESESEE